MKFASIRVEHFFWLWGLSEVWGKYMDSKMGNVDQYL